MKSHFSPKTVRPVFPFFILFAGYRPYLCLRPGRVPGDNDDRYENSAMDSRRQHGFAGRVL